MASIFAKIGGFFRGKKSGEELPLADDPPYATAAVFSTIPLTLDRDFLQTLAPEAQVVERPRNGLDRAFICRWEGVTITVNDSANWDRVAQVNGMKGFLQHTVGPDSDSAAVNALVSDMEATRHCFGCIITPHYDIQGRAGQFIVNLATALQGFVFSHQSFYDANGRRVAGLQDDPTNLVHLPSADQLARKERMETQKTASRPRPLGPVNRDQWPNCRRKASL